MDEIHDDIHAKCQRCGASLYFPPPDAYADAEGEIVAAAEMENAAEAIQAFVEDLPCPSCEYLSLRIVGLEY
ncbi:MAG: hypothetical protein M3361_19945 [Candidatus Tectomicrobia bacterium]|nr:hypothetical protein [Candidatus Tectomicrobia bacterium]